MRTLTQFDPNGAAAFLLEEKARLSESLLWKIQREYFQHAGVQAWSTGPVPHYVTNNAAFAEACAAVVFGFLCDCATPAAGGEIKRVQILELGSGSGRFAYLFLKTLLHLWSESPRGVAPFRYLMTDCADSNVTWYRCHPALQPFVNQGLLEFALFDITQDSELRLSGSHETLSPDGDPSPIVVIANYVFDSVPHDAFLVRQGRIFETFYSLYSDRPKAEISPGDSMEHLQYHCSFSPFEGHSYDNSLWDDILRLYAQDLNDVSFLFPSSVLASIERLRALSDGRLLLLSTDKAQHDRRLVGKAGDPMIEVHGSISVSVNYDAILEYIVRLGGLGLLLPHPHAHINTAAFLLGEDSANYRFTQFEYRRAIELLGPDDFYCFKRSFRELYPGLGLDALMSFIRLSRCDPRVLSECLSELGTHATSCPEATKEEVKRLALKSWENYFYIGEEEDLAFEIAQLLYQMEYYAEALQLLKESCRFWGPNAATSWNAGLCHYSLGDPDSAAACLCEAFALDRTFKPSAAVKT